MPDFALGNKVGESYCFSAICPIRREAPGSQGSFRSQIRDFLAELDEGAESPFTQIKSIHLCRLLIIDDLPFEGFPAKFDHLQSAYLLFTANIAGDLTSCLTEVVETFPDLIHRIWVNCAGYPGVDAADQFVDYLKKCQIETSFFFGGYPQASLVEVMKALETQKMFTEFLMNTQGTPALELKEKFGQFMDQIRQQPAPRPGTL